MNDVTLSHSADVHELGSRLAVDQHEVENNAWDMDVLTIVAICLAVGLSMLVLACVACFRVVRLFIDKKSDKVASPIVSLPNPFEPKLTSRQLIDEESIEVDCYKAFDVISQKPQIDLEHSKCDNVRLRVPSRMSHALSMSSIDTLLTSRDASKLTSTSSSNRRFLDVPQLQEKPFEKRPNQRARSMEDVSGNPAISVSQQTRFVVPHALRLNKSQTVPTFQHGAGLFTGPQESETHVVVTLNYEEKKALLTLTLQSIIGLPSKMWNDSIFVITYLFPKENNGIHSKAIEAKEVTKFNEVYMFWKVSYEELEMSTLRFCIFYHNKKRAMMKTEFVGEAFLQGSTVDWMRHQQHHFELLLHQKRLKQQSTREKYLVESLGELFVLLQYQAAANRMKVFVMKATNLPKSDKMIGQPVQYVHINLKRDDETIIYKETRPQSGTSPVWNQPFLFDIHSSVVDACKLEFIIMRGRRHIKEGVVGHVIIGADGTKNGAKHWMDTLSSWGLETARWHSIMPLFKYDDVHASEVPPKCQSAHWKEWKEFKYELR